MVNRGDADKTTLLATDRDRLQKEISNLLDLAASGVAAETIAPKVKERQLQLAKIEAQLRVPRQAPPNIEKLRAALEQRAEQWKADLRAEPKVARLLLRRLVGPLTLWDPEDRSGFLEWEATITADLLEGLVQLGTSPKRLCRGHAKIPIGWLGQFAALRRAQL